VGIRGFYAWEKVIQHNYEMLFSRPTPDQVSRVKVDKMPDDLDWISIIDRLADGDITKHKVIYETNYIECLNLMAYWNHRDRYVEQMNKAINRKNN